VTSLHSHSSIITYFDSSDRFRRLSHQQPKRNLILNVKKLPLNHRHNQKRSRLTVKLSGKRSPYNSTPKYYHLVRSNDVLYTDRFTIIFLGDRPNPLSELNQKTDLPCLPNLKLLSFAISDPSSGLTNLADPSCLLIGDSTDHLNEPLRAYRFRITMY
jgi:hypothetical protein